MGHRRRRLARADTPVIAWASRLKPAQCHGCRCRVLSWESLNHAFQEDPAIAPGAAQSPNGSVRALRPFIRWPTRACTQVLPLAVWGSGGQVGWGGPPGSLGPPWRSVSKGLRSLSPMPPHPSEPRDRRLGHSGAHAAGSAVLPAALLVVSRGVDFGASTQTKTNCFGH